MVRKIAGFSALLIAAGLTMAAQDKKDEKKIDYSTVIGTFESYKNETLILKVKEEEKKETVEKKYKVPGDTPVGYSAGKDTKPKILKAKDHLKDVKKGSAVAVTLDSDGKKVLAVGVFVTELPKDKPKEEEGSDK